MSRVPWARAAKSGAPCSLSCKEWVATRSATRPFCPAKVIGLVRTCGNRKRIAAKDKHGELVLEGRTWPMSSQGTGSDGCMGTPLAVATFRVYMGRHESTRADAAGARMDIGTGVSFDDVRPRPAERDGLPSQTSTRTRRTREIGRSTPFISSAMDTVTEAETAIVMPQLGGIGVLLRNLPVKE